METIDDNQPVKGSSKPLFPERLNFQKLSDEAFSVMEKGLCNIKKSS